MRLADFCGLDMLRQTINAHNHMKPTQILKTILTVFPILTAGLYLLGLSHHQGYLAAYEINDSIFPLASDKALFNGFFNLLTFTFPSIIYAVGVIGSFIILAVVAAALSSTVHVKALVTKAKEWLAKIKHHPIDSQRLQNFIDKSAALYVYATGIFLILLALFVMAVLSKKSGHEQASEEIDLFNSNKKGTTELHSNKLSETYEGMLVICGDKYCAFYRENEILILSHNSINKILIRKAKNQPKQIKREFR